MGIELRELIPGNAIREFELTELRDRVIAIDAYNMLYQFLAAIRQPDGTPLMDSRGRITSHLSGLFYRTINLMEAGIRPVYVFDGKPPSLKERELLNRKKRKEEAEEKYREALKLEKIEEAKVYAQMATRLTDDMVEDGKKLLKAMGIPIVEAPAEGEAQAAYMASKGDAWGAGSQDYDSILFGSPRLVRNLGITGKRKLPRKDVYIEIKPEVIEASILYKELGIDRKKLIVIGIMLGTDYNPDGIKGIGHKTALKIVKSYATAEEALNSLPTTEGVDYKKIYEYFLNPEVTDNYQLEWKQPFEEEIKKILIEEHDFSEDRVSSALERLSKASKSGKTKQKGLDAWFK
ncbi:MAG: flap endonuclease-1 [Fervidicoccaceae archaeon]